jgi:hypothetical protein
MTMDQATELMDTLRMAGVEGIVGLCPAVVCLDDSFTAEELLRIVAVLQQIDAASGERP